MPKPNYIIPIDSETRKYYSNPKDIPENMGGDLRWADDLLKAEKDPDIRYRKANSVYEIYNMSANDLNESYRYFLKCIPSSVDELNVNCIQPDFLRSMEDANDAMRDHYRGFAYPKDDPSENCVTDGDPAADGVKGLLKNENGCCTGHGHTDASSYKFLMDMMDDNGPLTNGEGIMFVEEYPSWMQEEIDDYLKVPPGVNPPKLSPKTQAFLDKTKGVSGPTTLQKILEEARQKGVEIVSIDNPESHSCFPDGREAESRTGNMNLFAEETIKKRIAAYEKAHKKRGKSGKGKSKTPKFIIHCGAKHSNTHEGGIPGLAQIFGVPAVKMKGGEVKADPEDKNKRRMPSKAEQLFMDNYCQEYRKEDAAGHVKSMAKEAVYAEATKIAERLATGGALPDLKELESHRGKTSKDEKEEFEKERARLKALCTNAFEFLKPQNTQELFKKTKTIMQDSGGDADKKLLFNMALANDVKHELVKETDPGTGATLLHTAAFRGERDLIRDLVKSGADVNAETKDGNTPLILACKHRRWDDPKLQHDQRECLDTLLKNNADIDHQNKAGQTALHLAAFNGNKESVGCLIDGKAKTDIEDNRGWTARDTAITSGKLEAEKVFYDKKKDANAPLLGEHDRPRSAASILKYATYCDNPGDKAKIQAAYEKLYADPLLRPIIELAALDAVGNRDPGDKNAKTGNALRIVMVDGENVGKSYNAGQSKAARGVPKAPTGGVGGYDEDSNMVAVGGKTPKQLEGVLIHELTHMASQLCFDSETQPFNNKEDEKAYKEAIQEVVKLSNGLCKDADEGLIYTTLVGRMSDYAPDGGDAKKNNKQLLQEFVVSVPQLVAKFGEDAVREVCPKLISYFEDTVLKKVKKTCKSPKYDQARKRMDNDRLDNRIKAHPEKYKLDEAPKIAWAEPGKSYASADEIVSKIKRGLVMELGVPKPANGADIVFAPDQFEIDDVTKKALLDKMMARIETAVKAAMAEGHLPPKISGMVIREFVDEAVREGTKLAVADHIRGQNRCQAAVHWLSPAGGRLAYHRAEIYAVTPCSNVRSWLQADIQSPEIEARFTPKSGHSEAHAGLPVLTHRRHQMDSSGPTLIKAAFVEPRGRRANSAGRTSGRPRGARGQPVTTY